MDRMPKLVSIVFSFKNEQKTLPLLVSRTVAVLKNEPEDYELIFVNDASTDGSLETLKGLRKDNARIKIVDMSRTFGVYECLMAGLSRSRGDAVIYMDSDLQDPPEVVPKMLKAWREGSDVVHTVRTKRHGESALRLALTLLAYRILARVSEIPLPVESGDYKLLSRRCVDHILSFRESDLYFRGLAVWIGYAQVSVEYEREARAAGQSTRGVLSSTAFKFFAAALTGFTFFPIFAVLSVGIASALLALLLAAAGGVAAVCGTEVSDGYWIFALIFFCWSTLLAAVGVVGYYVMRVYKDVRGRPPYIVREAIGFES